MTDGEDLAIAKSEAGSLSRASQRLVEGFLRPSFRRRRIYQYDHSSIRNLSNIPLPTNRQPQYARRSMQSQIIRQSSGPLPPPPSSVLDFSLATERMLSALLPTLGDM